MNATKANQQKPQIGAQIAALVCCISIDRALPKSFKKTSEFSLFVKFNIFVGVRSSFPLHWKQQENSFLVKNVISSIASLFQVQLKSFL